ncbi:unnamed protein product [Ostreobium quekettii]|uniref:Methyltransferase type 11 domain-containing protein n=1 Tax=Ostreobium quekettii TaxID=121088 RepID=A0A8S1J3M3_9CHLO|nr:unnamed protein product [Ostreobium quekettii]|eukprot:evm.model.scf_122.14 EVM.evm.TU.scf_122.14   scf_122:106505-111535(+)
MAFTPSQLALRRAPLPGEAGDPEVAAPRSRPHRGVPGRWQCPGRRGGGSRQARGVGRTVRARQDDSEFAADDGDAGDSATGDDRLNQESVWTSVMSLSQDIDLGGVLTAEERTRQDEQNDSIFYSRPRLVRYVDEGFCNRLKGWYGEHLHPGDYVLDLCSSDDSHLPCALELAAVEGHGMCQGELAANPALTGYFIQDLNNDPTLPLPNDKFDAVLCCMGLQYLVYPEKVLSEVRRVLKPGGKVLVSFSSHWFPEKTVTAWLERTLEQQVELVKSLLDSAGFEDTRSIVWIPEDEAPSLVSDSIVEATVDGELQVVSSVSGEDDDGLLDVASLAHEEDAVTMEEMLSQPRTEDHCPDPFCAVLGVCPQMPDGGSNESSLPGSVAFSEASELAELSASARVLDEMELWEGKEVGMQTLERWATVYGMLCQEAEALGIPKDAVPRIEGDLTFSSLREKRDLLRGMMASFRSSGL